LRFEGQFYIRSSVPGLNSGPPGEKALLLLNPSRRSKILALTGWPRLEEGSLNLKVPGIGFNELLKEPALWIEPGAEVRYPPLYSRIPKDRAEYYYYGARATVGKRTHKVLARRSKNPAGTSRPVELFASVNLTSYFDLKPDQWVEVEVGPLGSV
jgi:hypothetical protein